MASQLIVLSLQAKRPVLTISSRAVMELVLTRGNAVMEDLIVATALTNWSVVGFTKLMVLPPPRRSFQRRRQWRARGPPPE